MGLIETSPALANLELGSAIDAEQRVQRFAKNVRELTAPTGWCLIDPPPTLGVRMVAALASADAVVVPIELEDYSTMAVTDMLKTLTGVRQRWNPHLRFLGLLANRVMSNAPRQRAALTTLMAEHATWMLPTKLSTRTAIPRALEEGVPVWQLTTTSAREASAEVLHVCDAIWTAYHRAEVNS